MTIGKDYSLIHLCCGKKKCPIAYLNPKTGDIILKEKNNTIQLTTEHTYNLFSAIIKKGIKWAMK